MLLQKKLSYLVWLWLAALFVTCACTRGLAPEQNSRTYHKDYDKAWEAVTGVILDDLGCIESKLKKNKGYLETEWVNTFDTDGQHRWKIEAYLTKRKDAVTVRLEKIVQMRDDVSRTVRRYNNEKKDEPVGPDAGWSNARPSEHEIEDLYRRIDLRLGE
jgi:uncharacterized lipoprotein